MVWFRQPTVWDRYKNYVFAGIVLVFLQALLIFGLLWQRARNRKADLRLRESEKRFRLMADTTPALVWMCDEDGRIIYMNERRIEFTGRKPQEVFADTWSTYIHPDDRASVQKATSLALQRKDQFSREYRLRRRDGVYRWMMDVAAPRANDDGSFTGFIGSAIDITDQKLAREALEGIGGKLIEAQEKSGRA